MSSRIAAGASLLALACSVAPAVAQTRSSRPYRALFVGSTSNDTEQVLQLVASTDAGYDTNVLAGSSTSGDPGTVVPGTPQQGTEGPFTQFSVGLQYSLNRSRVGFAASANTAQRYYSSQADSGLLGTYGGGLSGWFQLAKKTRLLVNETSSYQPFLSYSYFPVPSITFGDEVVIPDVGPQYDLAIGHQTQTRNALSAYVTQMLTARSSVSVGGGYDVMRSSGNALDLTAYSAEGRFTTQLAKGLGVHAGYGYQQGRYTGALATQGPTPIFRTIDVGIDYNRPLSISRHTTLSFGTGSTALDDSTGTHYHVIGNASLNYEFRRSWTASIGYARDSQFLENIRQPVFADSVATTVRGLFTQRLEFAARASGSRGMIGGVSGDDFTSYVGTVSLTTGLTTNLAFVTSYSYFRSVFDRRVNLAGLFQPDLERQTVQAGLSFQLPILMRTRRHDAPR